MDSEVPHQTVVCLTGASGFVGRHVARRIHAKTGISLVCVGRTKPLDDLGARTITCSLEELTTDAFYTAGIERIDVVVHLAAATAKSAHSSPGDARRMISANAFGTEALLAALPVPPRRIVYSSTLDVYASPNDDELLSEWSPLGPRTPYAASKLLGEVLVRDYAQRTRSEPVVLRYGNVFGPGEESYGKLIPHTISELLKGRPPRIMGDGSALRDYLYVDDAVEATLRAMVTELRDDGPINVVRGSSHSITEVTEILVELTQFLGPIRYSEVDTAAASHRFDNARMFDVLGRWELRDLRDGLQQEISYVNNSRATIVRQGGETRSGPR